MISIAKNETLREHSITARLAMSIVIRHSLTLHIADRWEITRFVCVKKFLQNLKVYEGKKSIKYLGTIFTCIPHQGLHA